MNRCQVKGLSPYRIELYSTQLLSIESFVLVPINDSPIVRFLSQYSIIRKKYLSDSRSTVIRYSKMLDLKKLHQELGDRFSEVRCRGSEIKDPILF